MGEHGQGRDLARRSGSLITDVAIIKWSEHDELAEALADEVCKLGQNPQFFSSQNSIPDRADLILTFAPYGKWFPIAQQVGQRPPSLRPVFVHWNFEGIPDPRTPWALVELLSLARSHLDSFSWLRKRMLRFRYVGDYLRALRAGWLDVFAIISEIYSRMFRTHGVPAHFVPWGTSPRWYADLKLERDIDVLWFGKRRTPRRSYHIDRVRQELTARGRRMVVIDGIERPFVFGKKRTELLNRAKIVLNVAPLPFSSGFTFRFHMVAGNRALIVAESFTPASSDYQLGSHYVAVPPAQLAETILYYLEHEDERRALAENAYQLVTTQLTLGSSVAALMEHARRAQRQRAS